MIYSHDPPPDIVPRDLLPVISFTAGHRSGEGRGGGGFMECYTVTEGRGRGEGSVVTAGYRTYRLARGLLMGQLQVVTVFMVYSRLS